MAMEIGNVYRNYMGNSVYGTRNDQKKAAESKFTGQTNAASSAPAQPKLSAKAEKLLEKLKKTYGNVDFMVADFENGDDAKAILSQGSKEFSVLFSTDELEKMASDEKYEKEYMDRVQGAIRMSEQINQEFGFKSAFEEDGEHGRVTRIGMSFNQDGTATYFADLEKLSAKQKERMEQVQEDREASKKEEAKKAEGQTENEGLWKQMEIKRTTVQANSMEELAEKMRGVDWSSIEAESLLAGTGNIDISV